MSVCPSVCRPVCLSICQSVCLSICLSVHLSCICIMSISLLVLTICLSLSSLSFFGEDPPPSPGSLTWHTDTKPLAHQLLNLSVLTLTHGMSTPFQLCAIVAPKLVRQSVTAYSHFSIYSARCTCLCSDVSCLSCAADS